MKLWKVERDNNINKQTNKRGIIEVRFRENGKALRVSDRAGKEVGKRGGEWG